LLRRERFDGIIELLGSGDGLEEEGDLQFVLVLDDGGVLGLEEVCGHDTTHEEDETAQNIRTQISRGGRREYLLNWRARAYKESSVPEYPANWCDTYPCKYLSP
jgi:hypothetical protein